ncbi:1-acyl-sn-glycerol-3-phosphate acyltransferase [Pacificimonas flava]|uniref:1-acyl-sn-glycerol-3-phosphate acyltransferase n=1 Tax=Pacificimonas flava TaxID=1234595 RepID=M2SBQ2_9SPHN|nr:1-acyl-sn-glycerol-3-phosphate acyltransferase [Pacificimonas flava]
MLVPFNMLALRLRPDHQPRIPMRFHALMCHAAGINVHVHGRPATGTTLYVVNHLSWADILVLGRLLRARFLAKSELGDSSALAFFCAQQRTLFVDRRDSRGVRDQENLLTRTLEAGDAIVIFPESTTGDGRKQHSFKTPLFAGITDGSLRGVAVQPVSLAYTRVRSMPAQRSRWPYLCWMGDYGIGESVLAFLRLRAVRADVVFHEPVDPVNFAGRKALAAHCERAVHRGYRAAMRQYVQPQ